MSYMSKKTFEIFDFIEVWEVTLNVTASYPTEFYLANFIDNVLLTTSLTLQNYIYILSAIRLFLSTDD